MTQVSQALAVGATIVDLRSLNFGQVMRFWFDKATISGHFDLYGVLDSTTGNAGQNAQPLGSFDVQPGQTELPPALSNVLQGWAELLVVATVTATLLVEGNAAVATSTTQSVTAPVGTAFSALMTLTSYSSSGVRLMGSKSMTAADQFNVYGTNDLSTNPSATGLDGAQFLGNLFGGSGVSGGTLGQSLVIEGWAAVFFQRDPSASGATVGTIKGAGVVPPVTGGSGLFWGVGGNVGVSSPGVLGTLDAAALRIVTGGVAAILIGATGQIDVTPTGGNPLNLGNAAVDHATNIGNGTGASPLTMLAGTGGLIVDSVASSILQVGPTSSNVSIGNSHVASTSQMNSEGGSLALGAAGGNVDLTAVGASPMRLIVGTGLLNLGASGTDHETDVGSGTGVSKTIIQSGTSPASGWNVGVGATLSLVDQNLAATIKIGTNLGIKTIHIGDGNVANVLTIGALFTAATTLIQGGDGATALTLQTLNAGTLTANVGAGGTLSLGIGNVASTINLGIGTGGKTLHIADGAAVNTVHIADSNQAHVITMGGATSLFGAFGAAAVVRPIASATAAVTAAGATPANTETTYTGGVGASAYSVGGVILALKSLGWITT